MTDILQAAIKQGKKVTGIPVYGGWVEVDTVGDLHSLALQERIDKLSKST